MNDTIVTALLVKDDLDGQMYKKPLRQAVETYACYALGELKKGNSAMAEDYLQRLLIVLRGNR